jgi:hypothetical protein
MIFTAFNLLASQLNAYIQSLTDVPPTEPEVILANIAVIDSATDNINIPNQRVILSLVNIEEEATMKNRPHYTRANVNDIAYQNPPIFLNLYMLATAYYDLYENSLKRLSDVIQFFQSKSVFSVRNSPFNPANSNEENIEIFLEMYSMTFEQLNHLWGSLGGKQWPSVLYKVRLVRITDNRITGLGTVIEKIRTTETVITQ